MWLSALRSSWVVTLFRDEVLHTHSYVIGFFDTIKGYNKRISEVKDAYTYAVQNAWVFIYSSNLSIKMRQSLKDMLFVADIWYFIALIFMPGYVVSRACI